MRLRRFMGVALLVGGSTLAVGNGTASAGLTGCGGYTSGSTWNTSCNTANVGNPYPENEQRARVTCSGSGGGTTLYGPWKGVNVLSTVSCGLTMSNKTWDRR